MRILHDVCDLQETRIEVEIPKIKTDLGSAIHFVRFPNFISAEPRPFDPAVYEDEIEEDELLDEEGRTRLKLKVQTNIAVPISCKQCSLVGFINVLF